MSIKIVVLDGFTLTPNNPETTVRETDPQWAAIAELGNLTVYPRTKSEDIIARCQEAQIVLTNKVVLGQKEITALPDLKYISVLATGTNVVDLAAAAKAGIKVSNVPAYSTDSVAQHVFALTLELMVHTASHGVAVHQGAWQNADDFCFTVQPTVELAGKTLGIIGLGAIGKQVARIGHAFGMNIAALERPSSVNFNMHGINIDFMPIDQLLATADILTLHCPLTDATHHMMNESAFQQMKKTAVLINTGRGPLIDEPALAQALKAGEIAGAGLDVLSTEPPASDNPLIKAPRCIITPHIAWATCEARHRLMDTTTDNIKAYLAGSPINVVNG
ncbi:D-2-hydroxyacid dehydrogenase [Poriferisphaera sp. WC338]|uniref:D-2-hydroxyacid dehydrogenase n=1 Tax=Poriferisphaera sp. WC338 TaxID=3425129 RepID=UPI003D8169C9